MTKKELEKLEALLEKYRKECGDRPSLEMDVRNVLDKVRYQITNTY